MKSIALATQITAFSILTVTAFAAAPLKIGNELYAVEFNSGSFSIKHKPTGKIFAKEGRFDDQSTGEGKVVTVNDPAFGQGQAIEIAHVGGGRETIALFADLPFVLFRSVIHNGGQTPVVLNKVPSISSVLEIGRSLKETRTLGTGGLLEPSANPGSYAFLAVVDPASRAGAVGGWITHDRGSGVVFSPVAGDALRLQARIDYGRLRILPGADAEAETFALGWFEDARFGLEAYADAIAKKYQIRLHPQTPGFCTWYMDQHGRACDEKHLAELSEYAARNLKPFGFDFVQIDDGWQMGESKNGPNKNFTSHRPNGSYPSGMKAAADQIRQVGLTPGIWFMPFAGTHYDSFFKEHQDWFVKTEKGEPYETAWGGTCLDMTQAGAREHLRSIVKRIAHEWGYRLFKMDGFWTGSATKQIYVNNGYREDGIGDAVFSNPDKTNIEAMRDGTKLVREAAGSDVFLLGCCVSQNMRSFGGSFGLLDAMRVGPDTSGRIGSLQGSRLWFLNGRVWWNDPDCVYVRAATPLDEARLNASWAAISGQLFYDSDWIPGLPPERLDILKRCMPAHNFPARPADVFEYEPAQVWLLSGTGDAASRNVLAIYHWESKTGSVVCEPGKAGLLPATEYVGFDFWANRFLPPFRGSLKTDFQGRSCRVLAVRSSVPYPQVVSTSRHVTQGMIDLSDEHWNAEKQTLAGASRVVGGDPYELRIVVPTGQKSWQLRTAAVSDEDRTAGVTATAKQDGPKIRVTLHAPVSRTVRWTLAFEPASVPVPEPAPVSDVQVKAEYSSVQLRWRDNGADAWRVTRNDGATFECAAPEWIDGSVEHSKSYEYSVSSIGWDGKLSSPATASVKTAAELKPPATDLPDVAIADLQPVSVKTGNGKPGFGVNAVGKPLVVSGRKHAKGLGLHANALVVYSIPNGATRFVSVVGLDDLQAGNPKASVVFELYGDVKEMGEPPLLIAQSPALSAKTIRHWAFNAELNQRFREIRLVVTDAGDGNSGDLADWVEAGFMLKK